MLVSLLESVIFTAYTTIPPIIDSMCRRNPQADRSSLNPHEADR
jgi:hypothetical protein